MRHLLPIISLPHSSLSTVHPQDIMKSVFNNDMIFLNEQVTMNESASGNMGTMSWQHRCIFHFDQIGPICQCHLINIVYHAITGPHSKAPA